MFDTATKVILRKLCGKFKSSPGLPHTEMLSGIGGGGEGETEEGRGSWRSQKSVFRVLPLQSRERLPG